MLELELGMGISSNREKLREHIIDAATISFERYGYHGSGINHIIKSAGIAKTTLYRHFRTKEALIIAAIRKEDKKFRREMIKYVTGKSDSPREQLLLTFDFMDMCFSHEGFYGCMFITATTEFSDQNSVVFKEATKHKYYMIRYFKELATKAGYKNPNEIAASINVLHEGSVAVAQVKTDTHATMHAKNMAESFLAGQQMCKIAS